ncbi:exodeoxyribonuclease III [Carnimonas nigrificans]|uniref:exodeoxyribonuclease III n=1 Tax=Carnimonas nigrificans TaxID=64323 RepID=UPI000470101B|nr:exodeoxyribonuclease III [Carnimonas nigrificans]
MKLMSFNINGVRARPHQLQALVEKHSPDVIGLQETKVRDSEFPLEALQQLGYHVHFYGQKGHYGVAMMTKQAPLDVYYGLDGDEEDAQRRMIAVKLAAPMGEITVYNGYFPQGENVAHPTKFPNKREFYARLSNTLEQRHSASDNVAIMGDFNISPEDQDIGIGEDNRKRWLRDGKTSFQPEEREWLARLHQWGLVDSYRERYPHSRDFYSWFDYRSKGFDRDPKRGLRIDLILVSNPLKEHVADAGIDYELRAMEKPSDHCPIWTTLG